MLKVVNFNNNKKLSSTHVGTNPSRVVVWGLGSLSQVARTRTLRWLVEDHVPTTGGAEDRLLLHHHVEGCEKWCPLERIVCLRCFHWCRHEHAIIWDQRHTQFLCRDEWKLFCVEYAPCRHTQTPLDVPQAAIHEVAQPHTASHGPPVEIKTEDWCTCTLESTTDGGPSTQKDSTILLDWFRKGFEEL